MRSRYLSKFKYILNCETVYNVEVRVRNLAHGENPEQIHNRHHKTTGCFLDCELRIHDLLY